MRKRSVAPRRLALELLEVRQPLTATPFDTPPTPAGIGDATLGSSLHERNWLGESVQSEEGAPLAAPPYPVGDTFKLHSNPGATKVIYLDFDGHTTSGTFWNDLWDLPSIDTPAYSIDGDNGSFSNAELERIQIVWERVMEDFLPFDVDVTTEDPGVEALRKFGPGDTKWGIRVVIGEDQADTGAGGIAYIGSFTWATDTPAFVFNNSLIGVAEAASHEVGHTLGLLHDGQSGGVEYYEGHGTGVTSWAPIMGVGYDREVVQWSKGQYPRANRLEDDLAIITTQNGFTYRTDDHSNTTADATSLADGGTTLAGEGIIERNTDLDYFVFTAGSGMATINVAPFYRNPNLDILATLYNSVGAVVATSNPVSALNASISAVLTAGTYYLAIDGTGKAASGSDFGYSDYGSLGYFEITGTRADPSLAGIHGQKWNDRNGDGVKGEDEPGLAGWTIFLDGNSSGSVDAGEKTAVTDANGNYSIDGLQPGTYVVAELQKTGWKQTFPSAPGTYSVTLTTGDQSFGNDFGNQAGSIRGQKWFDRNANGLKDEGERGLAGWMIFLDTNNNGIKNDGEVATTTDADGNYVFFDLVTGTYTVAELGRAGWLQTFPAAPGRHSVAVGLAQQVTAINFGNAVGSIGGLVWNDRDGDGVSDDGEPPLEGWTVYLDANRNGAFDNGPTTVASANVPKELIDFTTIVSEIMIANMTAINDLDVKLNISHSYASDLDVFLVSPAGTRVELFTDVGLNGDNFTNTILDDEAATAITAGSAPFANRYRPEGLLSALDGQNPNGVWKLEITDDNSGDGGSLLGWSLTITTNETSTVTDAAGRYEFLELAGGEYALGRVAPANWAQTYPVAPGPQIVTIAAGQSVADANFGSRRAAITGQAWNDRDGDGAKDDGEPGRAGWTVYLDQNGNGALDAGAQTTTAAGLPKAIPDLGTLNSTIVINGLREVDDVNVTLSINHAYLADLDVTLVSPSGTRVELFSDIGGSGQNLNGTVLDDEAELPIVASPGLFAGSFQPEGLLADFDGENPNGVWTLEIIDDGGNDVGSLVAWSLTVTSHETSVVTDASGQFAFYDLPPGAYVVREVSQLGWTNTAPLNPHARSMTLLAGQQSANANFGAKPTVLFGDYDRNHRVDGNDFLLWQRGLGSSNLTAGTGADGDYSTAVNGLDLGVWSGHFGDVEPIAVASAFAAVEDEPTQGFDTARFEAAVDAAIADWDASALAGPLAYQPRARSLSGAPRVRFRPTAASASQVPTAALKQIIAVGDQLPVLSEEATTGESSGASAAAADETLELASL